jgi:hypothetical protein
MSRISARILGLTVFLLVPSVGFAQYGRESLAKLDVLGAQASRGGPWLGSGANGSDGNGSITPSGGEFDAHHTTAPSSKPPIAFRGDAPM